jgi:hypothetical protein
VSHAEPTPMKPAAATAAGKPEKGNAISAAGKE